MRIVWKFAGFYLDKKIVFSKKSKKNLIQKISKDYSGVDNVNFNDYEVIQMQGTVKWFNDEKGYGFIAAEGKDYFVHYSEIKATGLRSLSEGQQVNFIPEKNQKGITAIKVTLRSPNEI